MGTHDAARQETKRDALPLQSQPPRRDRCACVGSEEGCPKVGVPGGDPTTAARDTPA